MKKKMERYLTDGYKITMALIVREVEMMEIRMF